MIPDLSTSPLSLSKNVDFSKYALNPGFNKSYALVLDGYSRGFQLGNLDKLYNQSKSFAIMITVPRPGDLVDFGQFTAGVWTFNSIPLTNNFFAGKNFLIINSVGSRLDFLFNQQLLTSINSPVDNMDLVLSTVGSLYDPGVKLVGDLFVAQTFSLNDLKIFNDYCIFGDYNK